MTWITKYKPSRKSKNLFKTIDKNFKSQKPVLRFKTFLHLRTCKNPEFINRFIQRPQSMEQHKTQAPVQRVDCIVRTILFEHINSLNS